MTIRPWASVREIDESTTEHGGQLARLNLRRRAVTGRLIDRPALPSLLIRSCDEA
jgi:hypothetical protein